jgi:hypothetical protein
MAMTIERISVRFIVAMMLCTALAVPPAHAAPTVTFDKDGVGHSTVEDFVMFDKDSTPQQRKCLLVQRWVDSIESSVDHQGNKINVPMIRQATRATACTIDARPYEDSGKLYQRMIPVNQPPVQLK